MHKLVHAWGQDRLEVEQQRHLNLMALELLTDIIPSTAGNPIFGIRLVPHVVANFAIVSGTTAALATMHDEILDSVAMLGGFKRVKQSLPPNWVFVDPWHRIRETF
jgi:hypothetical protein